MVNYLNEKDNEEYSQGKKVQTEEVDKEYATLKARYRKYNIAAVSLIVISSFIGRDAGFGTLGRTALIAAPFAALMVYGEIKSLRAAKAKNDNIGNGITK